MGIGRRLTAMLAAMTGFELLVAADLPERWIYALQYHGPMWRYAACLRTMSSQLVGPLFSAFFLLVATLATLALAARLARGAAPGSARDPVIKVRDFFRRHPSFGTLLPWAPALLLAPMVAGALQDEGMWRTPSWFVPMYTSYPLALALLGTVVARLGRTLLRALDRLPDVAPTEAAQSVDRGETSFLAVAVTGRTRGAVLAMTALSLGMVVVVASADRLWLRDTAHGLPLAAYFASLVGVAVWFRKASTIAVGRDGIFIRGTSKPRFFGYSSFDEVRLTGVHLDLVRAGKVVLRLQLHGADAARAESLAERIRAALALSNRTDGAHLLARTAVAGLLGRAAQGATDYRQASVTREQLWELVEGEATDEQARVAAATALADSGGREDRGRLRVAAAHVADPRVRIALEELAEEHAPPAAMKTLSKAFS
jgi:hypothetical protein